MSVTTATPPTSRGFAGRRRSAARARTARRALLIGVLIAGGILMMIPFLWMISTSLKTRAEVFAVPPTLLPRVPQWQNYPDMWASLPFGSFFFNSLKLSVLNTIGALVSCSMAAYAFAVLRFRFREPLFALLLVTLIIPFQVVLVPNFVLYRLLPHPFSTSGNWIGTQEPLWVGAFLGGAFGTFLLRQFFLSIPRELADAARVDGANPWHIYRFIYLRDVSSLTLTAGLSLFQGQYVGKWPLLMAGALVSVLPMIFLFILAQRHFVRGIAMSGIKG